MISRRGFFLAAGSILLRADDRPKRDMLVRSVRPEDLEMPLAAFSDYITPIEHFFVRTHVYAPTVNANDWRLKVEGEALTALAVVLTASTATGRPFQPLPMAGEGVTRELRPDDATASREAQPLLRTFQDVGKALRAKLRAVIDAVEDQVRIYPLDERTARGVVVLGARVIEERQDFWIVW